MQGRWWYREGKITICQLCPHNCHIPENSAGFCQVRTAGSQGIELPAWALITAENLDPIEKKPLYHFYPGQKVWSAGFSGCNMRCPFCQNYQISQSPFRQGSRTEPHQLVHNALKSGSKLLAFTYSEPAIHAEYVIESARLARQSGLKTVLITNGCINKKPAQELLSHIDGVNIDYKSPRSSYYRKTLKGDLETVRNFIQIACRFSWVELTTLVIPNDNDDINDFENMCRWISDIDNAIPLHLSAYYPAYKYKKAPTSPDEILKMAQKAREYLRYVYLGNIGAENNTACHCCGTMVIRRNSFIAQSMLKGNRCPECAKPIHGVYT